MYNMYMHMHMRMLLLIPYVNRERQKHRESDGCPSPIILPVLLLPFFLIAG